MDLIGVRGASNAVNIDCEVNVMTAIKRNPIKY
jgi:hypothetical protein